MWKFRKMAKNEDSANPIQGEFFATEEVGDVVAHLVREAIQNSLDARVSKKDKPATVRFSYKQTKFRFAELSGGQGVFSSLVEHLESGNSGLIASKIPGENEVVDYLVIEDFGTKGLIGDPDYNDIEAPVDLDFDAYDFFFFWRNIGRSKKREGQLGSWGLGKQVFPAASRINTYFGLTCRNTDNEKMLMGKSILKIHHHAGSKYAPYGYYGSFDDDGFALPCNELEMNNFLDIFSVTRSSESGLSVIVPFPRIGFLDQTTLISAVAKEYFYPILRGKLRVEICYFGGPIIIDASSLQSVVRAHVKDNKSLLRIIELVSWQCSISEDEYITLWEEKDVDLYKKPSWSGNEICSEVLEQLKYKLAQNKRVAIRVPVRIHRKDSDPVLSHFSVCVADTDMHERVRPKYIRQGIDVKNATQNRLGVGRLAIVEAYHSHLGNLLRMAEPPTHDKWEARNNDELSAVYETATATVSFIRNAPFELWRNLSEVEFERDVDLLRNVFHVNMLPDSAGSKPKTGKKKEKRDQDEDLDEIKKPVTRMIRTDKLTGDEVGFAVRPADNATDEPKKIVIKVAYMVPSGSPFSKKSGYSEFDFRLDRKPIDVRRRGCSIKVREKNLLIVEIDNPSDFEVVVVGFDPHRDLYLDVKPSREGTDHD